MPQINWDGRLTLGIDSIDSQHEKIVRFYNTLVDLVESNKEEVVILHALENLCAQTVTHFEYEEQLMEQAKFPSRDAHRREHNDLIRTAETVVSNARLHVRDTLTPTIMAFLGRWITSHIEGADRLFVPHLKEKNIL